jgi:acyl-CoA thioesterase-1
MRRNKLLFIAFIVFIALSGCEKREIKNINSRGTNIICFGDSITFGYGVNTGQDYPSILSKMLDMPVINAGIDGDNTTEALKRINSDVLEKEPLLVIIEFGGNDFLARVPINTTINNIKEMIERIQEKEAIVALCDISAGLFLRDYRLEYKKIAKEKQAIFIPSILRGIITNPHMKSDFLHPNADGYKVIAQRIYHAVLPYLNQNILSKRLNK